MYYLNTINQSKLAIENYCIKFESKFKTDFWNFKNHLMKTSGKSINNQTTDIQAIINIYICYWN